MGGHLSPAAVERLLPPLLHIPLSKLGLAHEPVGRVEVDLGEEDHQPLGDVELLLIVQEVLGVGEILPLRLRRLVGRRRVGRGRAGIGAVVVVVGVGLEVEVLPLPVLAAELDLGDKGIEGRGRIAGLVGIVGRGEGEIGADLEAAAAAAAVVGLGFVGGAGDEEEEGDGQRDVEDQMLSAHRLLSSSSLQNCMRMRAAMRGWLFSLSRERERERVIAVQGNKKGEEEEKKLKGAASNLNWIRLFKF